MIPSANEIKEISDEVYKAQREKEAEKERLKRIAELEKRNADIEKALEILENTAGNTITEAAKLGLKTCRLRPMDEDKFYYIMNDEAFVPFIMKLRGAGYIVNLIQSKDVCKSDDFYGYTTYNAYFEVNWK